MKAALMLLTGSLVTFAACLPAGAGEIEDRQLAEAGKHFSVLVSFPLSRLPRRRRFFESAENLFRSVHQTIRQHFGRLVRRAPIFKKHSQVKPGDNTDILSLDHFLDGDIAGSAA